MIEISLKSIYFITFQIIKITLLEFLKEKIFIYLLKVH
jgi:hypothetical protein